jgi:hypothetical protein
LLDANKPWYIPAFIPEERRNREPVAEDVVLFTIVEPGTGHEYIPVFDEYSGCDEYLLGISPTKKDGSFAIYAFGSLSEIDKRVRQDFGRKVDLIVYSTEKPDEEDSNLNEEEELDEV